jgi:hypothetical protein
MSHTLPFKSQNKEREDKLPVHRHLHEDATTVYAYAAEIDEWRCQREVKDGHEEQAPASKERIGVTPSEIAQQGMRREWVIATIAILIAVAVVSFLNPG